VEQLTALRCIPNMTVIRPADSAETAEAWRTALLHTSGPVALVLTRQKCAFIDHPGRAAARNVEKGGYVLVEATGGEPQVILMASGSEVGIALEAQKTLAADHGARARVVSLASHELFLAQPAEYRAQVLPRGVPKVAIEAAHPMSWARFVGDDGVVIGVERFGASAPFQKIYEELGITSGHVVQEALKLTKRQPA
jgi:transketolase